jgi:hypothetical protein
VDWDELHRLLDQELNRLPAKYRSGIILCDLEGRSRKEAARQLGLPEGTLSSRLATGRQMLARRLAPHGIGVPAAGLAAALAAQAASASVGPALLSATARAAVLTTAGQTAGLVSTHVVTLTQGVLKTMLLHRLKALTILLLGTVLGGLGAGVIAVPSRSAALAQGAQAAAPPAAQVTRAAPEEPLDAKLLLSPEIQQELRLSKNQVQRLKDAASSADRQNEGTRKEIQQLQERIAQLQKQLQSLREKTEADRDGAVRRAAPDILSARALERLRQIQRQHRSPDQLLKDPRVQRWLKLDDEQMMKIEKAFKDSPGSVSPYVLLGRVHEPVTAYWEASKVAASSNVWFSFRDLDTGALAKVAEILTPAQRRSLRAWMGEPFQGANLDWLQPTKPGKSR